MLIARLLLARLTNALRGRLPARIYLWVCDRLYGELSLLYDPVAALVSAGRWRGWVERAAVGLNGRVLEVGPGPGHALASARARGISAVAVELSPAMAVRAAARSPGAVARGNALSLPVRTASVDAVVVTFPAPYVRDRDFWREAARVLKPGGRMRILLDAGPAYAERRIWSLDAPTPGWRLRKARVAVPGATLGFLLARRTAPKPRPAIGQVATPVGGDDKVIPFPGPRAPRRPKRG